MITRYNAESFKELGLILSPHPNGELIKVKELQEWIKSKTGEHPRYILAELMEILRGNVM